MYSLEGLKYPATVLVVDDNPADVMLTQMTIQESKFLCNIETAEDGADAQQKMLEGLTPALILLDLNMPVMDGREFMAWLNREERFRDIPVIVLAESGLYSDVNHANLNHCTAYVRKPVQMDSLVEILTRLPQFGFIVTTRV